MSKSDFLLRTVTIETASEYCDCDGNKLPMVVTRSRSSNGFRSITARLGKMTVEFNSDLGDNYETAAREFARMITEACDHSCALPAIEPEPPQPQD